MTSGAPQLASAFLSSPGGGAVISYRAVTSEGDWAGLSCIVTGSDVGASVLISGDSTATDGPRLLEATGVQCSVELGPAFQYLYVIFAGDLGEWSYDIDAPLLASGPEVLYLEAEDFAAGTGASGAFVVGAANVGLARGIHSTWRTS